MRMDSKINAQDNVRIGTRTDPLPRRPLGRTGSEVTILGLGGEGILRTHRRTAKAVQVINRALDLGITYCDTAPAYDSMRDYPPAAMLFPYTTLFVFGFARAGRFGAGVLPS